MARGNEGDMSGTTRATVLLDGGAETWRGIDVEAVRVERGREFAIGEVAGKPVAPCLAPRVATSCEVASSWWLPGRSQVRRDGAATCVVGCGVSGTWLSDVPYARGVVEWLEWSAGEEGTTGAAEGVMVGKMGTRGRGASSVGAAVAWGPCSGMLHRG